MKRRLAEKRGRAAETVAAWWLRLRGWRILARRVRTPVGEVDLIARRRRTLAFVEVKARATAEQLDLAIDVILLCPGRLPRHLCNIWHG